MSIETSTRCSCGAYVVLHHGRRWEATCTSCYGPVEDSPATEMVRGIGKTPLDALSDWQEQHDDAWDVTLVVTDLFGELARQVSEERAAQNGWRFECAGIRFHAGTTLAEVQDEASDENCFRGPSPIQYGPEAP